MNPLNRIADKIRDELRERLAAAMPQSFPGKLRLTCMSCSPPTEVDGDLTGSDLVGVIEWLNKHSGHGERSMSLSIPAGVETKVEGIQ